MRDAFYLRKIVSLTDVATGDRNMNLPWGGFNADFILYKGVSNTMEFVVRDIDRKPIPLQGKSIKVRFIDNYNQELRGEKDAKVTDPYKGRIKLTLAPNDTVNWGVGQYRYVVLMTNEDGSLVTLFIDFDQQAAGVVTLSDSILPQPHPVYEITELTPVGNYPNDIRYSGAFPAPKKVGYSSRLITAAVYFDNFTGSFGIQGSIDNTPTEALEDWFDIELEPGQFSKTYTQFIGIDAFNIETDALWIRFKSNAKIGNTGSITKILYKN